MKATALVISKKDLFIRMNKNNEKLLDNFIQKLEFSEYRILNQAQVANVEVDKDYYHFYERMISQISIYVSLIT